MNSEREELAVLYVLDQLDPAERAAFERRLRTDPALVSLVRECEARLEGEIHTLPQGEPPAGLLPRLETQLNLPAPASVAARPLVRWRWPVLAGWGCAAAITLSLVVLAVQSLRRKEALMILVVGLDRDRSVLSRMSFDAATARDPDTRFMQLALLAENAWRNSTGPKPASTGEVRAFFDPKNREGFVVVQQLQPLEANYRYRLWVVDPASGSVFDAGAMPEGGRDGGLFSFTVDPAADFRSGRAGFFITAETVDAVEAPGPLQPRGKVVLGNRSF